ncbi:MAG: 4-alpha-glucanotransferase, partial [Trueperaceae bacterium]|nr:4-alpha-glucanotransferase [Trueperaceae bacterium]
MAFDRRSGIILHPTSLPGAYGIGTLGREAYNWIEFLASAGQRLWQVMPLGPTGYGDSPYQCFSAFAGNPYLINLEKLESEGWLTAEDLATLPSFSDEVVDYGPVIEHKLKLLSQAYERFKSKGSSAQTKAFQQFCADQADWLDDYALFMSVKEAHGGQAWNTWDKAIRQRKPKAIKSYTEELADPISRQKFWQWLFFNQWLELRHYANERDIKIIGDIPIFIAYDSADAWANPDLFYLDKESNPTVIAGVPPDYFSATGQRWGNPLYRWEEMQKRGYTWWLKRIKATLTLVDIIRIDHFRGFEAYWEIPASEPTAVKGRWVKGPGQSLFDAIKAELGELPIIAEDLGVITPKVESLRDDNDLPGMKVLQFAFAADASDPYLPHNYNKNCVVYSG